MTRSCTPASTISTFAPSPSKRSMMSGSHRPHLLEGVIITVCPRMSGMLGPNIGCVPITSTPSGDKRSIASSGFCFTEVMSMRRLPRTIFGAISSIVASVTSIGTEITTMSLSRIALSWSCAYVTPSRCAMSTLPLLPRTATSCPRRLKNRVNHCPSSPVPPMIRIFMDTPFYHFAGC